MSDDSRALTQVTGERPAAPIQESILCALAFNKRYGAAIAAQVTVEHFDEHYRPIAEGLLAYRLKEKKPPGDAHLDDVFADCLIGKQASQYRKLMFGLLHLSKNLNARWVAEKTGAWVEEQRLKGATLAAAEIFSGGGKDVAEQVRNIFHEAITTATPQLDPGLGLTDTRRAFKFLDKNANVVKLGIKPFDRKGLALAPRQLIMYIAAKGRGKTWFAVHCGTCGLRAQKNVLHITLEISDTDVASRYYACYFKIAPYTMEKKETYFTLGSKGRLEGVVEVVPEPLLYYNDAHIREDLHDQVTEHEEALGRVLIKEFPAGSLTLPQLEHHLDFLAFQYDFVPDMLIIDYPDLMRIEHSRDYRISLGRLYVGLRGLAVRRNLILVAPTQGNRSSLNARRVRSSNVSEDITKVQTADIVMTYSATDDERRKGFGRLSLEHARGMPDGLYCMISQNYAMGQFILKPQGDEETAFEITQSDKDLATILKLDQHTAEVEYMPDDEHDK